MTKKKQVIDYLLSKSGKLGEEETWADISRRFEVEPTQIDGKRNKNLGRKPKRWWVAYVKQQDGLKLDKQIYENGSLKWETFKNKPEPIDPIDTDIFQVDFITTNPYGGAWFKMKRKEHIHTDEHLQALKDMLLEEINPQDYNIEEPVLHDRGLFIYGADKHIGALTKKDSMYSNDYDEKEIEKRIITKTIQNIKKTRNMFGIIESLYIMDLGDALDGFNQKTTGGLRGTSSHTLPQQMNNREQYDIYVRVHKILFDLIVREKLAKNIYFVATSNSNHGGDFEYCAMRNVEDYLNLKYPFIQTVVNYFPLNHFIYGNHAIIFGHGKDDEDMKNGMPLNLNDKVENYLNDYIRMNSLEMYNVTFVSADLHQSSENYGKALRYKKVLSQFGSTKWMHTNFGSGSPGISFDIFEKNSKLIWKADDFFEIDNQSNTGITFK